MQEPTPVPLPDILDPERGHLQAREHTESTEEQLETVRQAFADACAYGRQLWQDIDRFRSYLLHSLPPDPRTPGPHPTGASPTGPDDEQGWRAWSSAYAEATSVLAGPQGDSGFGVLEARQAEDPRRDAPAVRVHAQPSLAPDAPAGHRAEPGRAVRSGRTGLGQVAGIAVGTLLFRAVLVRRLRRR